MWLLVLRWLRLDTGCKRKELLKHEGLVLGLLIPLQLLMEDVVLLNFLVEHDRDLIDLQEGNVRYPSQKSG